MAASQLIPEEVEKIGKAWHFYFRTWWFFHYFIGVAGVVSAITVANNPKFLQAMPFVLDGLAWFSAICVSLLTFLEPKKRARAYVAAWRVLHKEMGSFRYGSSPDAIPLFDAVKKGEDIIAQSDS